MKRVFSYLGLISFIVLSCSSFHFERNNHSKHIQKDIYFRKDENYKKERLYDIDFNERFDLYYLDTFCFVVDSLNNKEIYSNDCFFYPYAENISYHVFNDSPTSDFKFFCSDGTYLWQPEYPECRITIEDVRYGDQTQFYSVEEYINESEIPSNAHLINNYKYFTKLENNHSYNPDNRCCLVAIQILAGYYDTFYNDDYVPEEWDRVSFDNIYNTGDWKEWNQSPGAGRMGDIDDSRMLDYLTDYTLENVEEDLLSNGLTFYQQKSVLDYYLTEQCVGYITSYCGGSLYDYFHDGNRTKIQNGIDNNYPVIANGLHHSVVAFGYDNDYVYLADGYGDWSRVEWYVFTEWSILYCSTSVYLIPTDTHLHSNNFYSSYDDSFYCSCGEEWVSNLLDFSQMPFPNVPSSLSNSFYHYFTTTDLAILSYTNIYKDSNNNLVFTGNSTLSILFTANEKIRGVMLSGVFNFSFNLSLIQFNVEFLDSSDYVYHSFNAKKHSFFKTSSIETSLPLNGTHLSRQLKIKVRRGNLSFPETTLVLNKMILSYIN